MARIDIKGTAGGGGSGTVTSVAVSSTTLTVTGSPITTSGTITANIPDGYLKVGTGVTGSLQNVVDTNGTATQLFLSSTGIQATSKIQITTADTSYIDAEDNSGNNRFTVGRDPSSQLVTVDFASVPTVLTTPVGAIRTATDGVTLANVMTFLENGNIGLGTDSPGSKFDVHSSGATVAQFNKTVSGNSYIQQLTAGAGKWKHGFTSATGAFDIIDDVNSLTRLSLLNTGQLKLNAYTSTSAFTGTTAGFLAFDASGNILSVTSPATSPSGVAGSVQFTDGTNFASDGTNFFWDDTNNRLGIGTNAPASALSLVQTIALAAGATNPRIENIAYTINNTGAQTGTATGIFLNATETALNGQTHNLIDLQVGGVSKAKINSIGALTLTNSLTVGSSTAHYLQLGAGLVLRSPSDGVVTFLNNAESSFNRINLGGTTSSFPAIKRASNNIEIKNADDTFGAGLSVGAALNASAILQADSTTKGFLPPRMTTVQKNAIATPAAGLVVYDSTLNKLCVYTTAWETITSI